MKKLLITLILVTLTSFVSFSQESKPEKKSQADLPNEFFVGYGGLSLFYFNNGINHNFNHPESYQYDYDYNDDQEPNSPGTFFFGYNRTLNKVISTGFEFGYQYLERKQTVYFYEPGPATYESKIVDDLFTGMARISFCYLNKPFIRMYSGAAIGISVDFAKEYIGDNKYTDRKVVPAVQMTLMGLRFGRSLGGFVEFGYGSFGIANFGLSYKISD